MIFIESLMLAVVIFVLCVATITDFKRGVVPNRLLIIGSFFSGILDIVYYIWFYGSGFFLFVINVASIFFLAILFYALEIWAAGDSKLLIFVSIGLPSRIYTFIPLKYCPLFVLVMIVFSIAFIYIACETLVRSFKEKRHFTKEFHTSFSIKKAVYIGITIVFMVLAVLLCNIVLSYLFKDSEGNNTLLILAVNFVCTLLLIDLRKKISIKIVGISSIFMFFVTVLMFSLRRYELSFGKGSLLALIVMVITVIIRMLSEKYNYKEVSIEELSSNMILSMATSLRLNMVYSFDEPLPLTEKRQARLTPEQVAKIKNTVKRDDCSTIVIVRKIPFAIFIFVGTLIFLGSEAAFIWFI